MLQNETYEEKERRQQISSLRALCDWLEENPEVPLPHFSGNNKAYIFCYSNKEKFNKIRRAGKFNKKRVNAYDFTMVKAFEAFEVELSIDRNQVCERVQTGVKVIPATESLTIEAKPERTEPIYDWVCPDSFLEKLNGEEKPQSWREEMDEGNRE